MKHHSKYASEESNVSIICTLEVRLMFLKKVLYGHKFAPKAIAGVFMGYSETSNAFKKYFFTKQPGCYQDRSKRV